MSGRTRLRQKAHTKAMTIRIIAILPKEEPVFLLTAHSIGRAWHKAIIMPSMVACLRVSWMVIIAAMPEYVPAAAPDMKMTADEPGSPKNVNIGLR